MLSQAAYSTKNEKGWFLTLAIFIFFFNTIFPIQGLTLTFLFTPAWIFYLQSKGYTASFPQYILLLFPFILAHLLLGIDINHYFVSTITIIALLLFIAAFNRALQEGFDINGTFKAIILLNFALTLISIPILFSPFLRSLVWYMVPISNGLVVPRLKLFTSEASHYSLWLAPVAVYFYSLEVFLKPAKSGFTLFMITLPLLLSFSLGVLGALSISFIIAIIFYYRYILLNIRRRNFLTALLILLITLCLLYFLYPNNPLSLRLQYIWQGKDTSAKGRTFDAFILANKIIAQKSYLWGIGPGQLNIIGRNTILQYYSYSSAPAAVRIPNACAETILFFGYAGFTARIALEIFLFLKTKVFNNPFRLWLFAFMFIYQFTGSYITNVTEYIIWTLAFSSVLPELTLRNTNFKPQHT